MRAKVLSLIILLLSCSLTFSACVKGKGLEIGFEYETNLDDVMGAVKSEQTSFAVDDVTLDFYFGGSVAEYSPDSGRQTVGLALYFCNEKAYRNLDIGLQKYASYKDIDGMYFVKLISTADFNSGDYNVDVTLLKGKVFQHNEVLTVPKEIFASDDDHFGLAFIEFYTDDNESRNGYYISTVNCLVMKYKFLNDATIELMKPSHMFG